MIILIPLGGTGERFKNEGYNIPKSLIKVSSKEIIYHLIDNLKITKEISYIYIPYNKIYKEYNFEDNLKKRYSNIKFKFFVLENKTRGAAETIFIALKNLIETEKEIDKSIISIDSDNFYTTDILKDWKGQNMIISFTSKNKEAIFSYITKDENDNILDIKEKNKISDYACTGAYGFQSLYELYNYSKKIIVEDKKQKGEYYISGIIKDMLKTKNFKNLTLQNKNYFSLGTPKQVKMFEQTFLFDLDGTLVNTDDIYIKVWKDILENYNIKCDKIFFDYFIKGKSDVNFLKFFISDISDETISNLSKKKDELFISYLKNNKNILLEGVLDFFDKIQNSKIAIVTSCNRSSAQYILNSTKLINYVNILVSANDVKNHKPNPEPYNKAIQLLNSDKKNSIIFEDSYSGYSSAKNSNVSKIILIESEDSCEEIKKTEEMKIKNYKDLDLTKIFDKLEFKIEDENIKLIKKNLSHLPIKNIKKNDIILKAGYICNILVYGIIYNDNTDENIILKISNLENELANTARKLNLYKNELYFYKELSHLINIKIPKYYNSFMNNNREGILMEDMNKYVGKFDLNLNKNITILLKIVENVFKMHNKYYFDREENILPIMNKLKKINEISYYKSLIQDRFKIFIEKNEKILCLKDKKKLIEIFENFESIINKSSQFPLSFCHGDLKSPNIFFKENTEPYFLDWQYIHLNKGISDIVFLLVESIEFDKITVDLVINYYYKLLKEARNISYEDFMIDVKNSLCIFPFFVCVWFNSENSDKLLDPVFPIRFMKNLLLYYNNYL